MTEYHVGDEIEATVRIGPLVRRIGGPILAIDRERGWLRMRYAYNILVWVVPSDVLLVTNAAHSREAVSPHSERTA